MEKLVPVVQAHNHLNVLQDTNQHMLTGVQLDVGVIPILGDQLLAVIVHRIATQMFMLQTRMIVGVQ